MKKYISLLLAIVMCLSLFACDTVGGKTNDSDTETYIETVAESETDTTDTEIEEGSSAVSTETASSESEPEEEMTEGKPQVETTATTTVTTATQTETVTESENVAVTQTEPETQTETETEDVMDKVDFIVSVPEGRDPVILHLTDPQIIDSSQKRAEERLNSDQTAYWSPERKDVNCYDYLREIIGATNPDLILVTGDLVYGEFDDNGENLLEFIKFMESFNIPWAPVFGNHDNESKKGIDWQCRQLENAENCLFKQRTLTGNGNYTVGIEQGGKLTRVFFMLDSNGCGAAQGTNYHTQTTAGFGNDQISWYIKTAKAITSLSPKTKLSMAFHIQLAVFRDAFSKYKVGDSYTNTFIDNVEGKDEGDFGYIGVGVKGAWDSNYSVWNSIKKLGFDSIFVGHEHSNSASIVYEGVRLQYGMKCSVYDRSNYINSDGSITTAYYSTATPWLGGSVFSLDASGEIKNPHIYYCNASISPSTPENTDPELPESPGEEATVGGLGASDFTTESGIEVTVVEFNDEINAYRVVATNQGKVKINVDLVKNKSTFTFSVYVPSSSTKLAGYGEFALRIKPNALEPNIDGSVGGYINFNSSSSNDKLKIEFDSWQTFTVDISGFGESCTEFSFVIAAGNTIYLKDMTIQ